jgi:hypothetical protein
MPRCEHGFASPCPWVGCPLGIPGARLAVPGPHEVTYYARAIDVVNLGYGVGRIVLRWREVVRVPVIPARRTTWAA